MTKTSLLLISGLALLISSGEAFSAVAPPGAGATEASAAAAAKYAGPSPSRVRTPDNFLTTALEYPDDVTPDFDVLESAVAFASARDYDDVADMYASDYVFRGSIVGPITSEDVKQTQQGFRILDSYPDIETRPFGFTIDPDNPFRAYYFERWEGTNTGDLQIGSIKMKATNKAVKMPTHVMSLHFNKFGKVRYACLSPPLDRFEGNTGGAGAVFGLLTGGGLNVGGVVGDLGFRLQQRLGHALGSLGRSWSREIDIPLWWRSRARGADPTDM